MDPDLYVDPEVLLFQAQMVKSCPWNLDLQGCGSGSQGQIDTDTDSGSLGPENVWIDILSYYTFKRK